MKHLLILIIVINNSCSCQSSLNNFEFKLYKLLVADTLSNSLFKEIQIESKNLYFRKNLSEVFVKTTNDFIAKINKIDTFNFISTTHSSDYTYYALLSLNSMLYSIKYASLDSSEQLIHIINDLASDSVEEKKIVLLLQSCIFKLPTSQKKLLFDKYKNDQKVIYDLSEALIRSIKGEEEIYSFISYILHQSISISSKYELYKHIISCAFEKSRQFSDSEPSLIKKIVINEKSILNRMKIDKKDDFNSSHELYRYLELYETD
ncbi:MAG: hypothetical protein IPJ43_04485 [Saprospiraceae bacterium]|nr:hypothetical protein [Saprospiraceae bacterium]MBK7466116.1 hypothetical protein [Saprospiraceae bacterium]MBK9994048.1 hypothetical protein [Saprospiraceae bacterium]